jgi:exopolysaccharide production protein ExoQ
MGWLFRRDLLEKPNVTRALWIPIAWMVIIGSRAASRWLNIFGLPIEGGTSMEEGSPLDALLFLTLIAAGWSVLARRNVRVAEIMQDNPWLTLFLAYCLISIVWSDFPFNALKRWIKILGHPIMVLIVFTEPDPKEALMRLFKRCAYILLPVSILWMKYYPLLGRKFTEYGSVSNCGVTAGKNALGNTSAILSLFFVWHFLQVWRQEKSKSRSRELQLTAGLVLLSGYCLAKAHSATSDICFMLGVATMIGLAIRSVNKKMIGMYAVAAIFALVVAQLSFDIYGKIVDMSGHGANIIGRGVLWHDLLALGTNPLLGVGFETFWLEPWIIKLHEGRAWQPNEAHNGYLEIYLNLGGMGLAILAGWIIATFRKIRLELIKNLEWGRIQMAVLVAIVAHNWTESGFKGLGFAFFIFFIIAVNYPELRFGASQAPAETSVWDQEPEVVYSQDRSGKAGVLPT